MSMLGLRKTGCGIEVYSCDTQKTHGTLRMSATRPGNDSFYSPVTLEPSCMLQEESDTKLTWVNDRLHVCASLNLKDSCYGYSARLHVQGSGCTIIRLIWELPDDNTYFPFVPAFMYGDNKGGASPWSTYPQLEFSGDRSYHKPWAAGEWLVRTDRSSHGFTSMIGSSYAYAMGGRDICLYADGSTAQKTGIGVSTSQLHRISFSLGYCNVPYTYSTVSGRNYFCRPDGYVNLDKGDVTADIHLYIKSNTDFFSSISELLRKYYWLSHDAVIGEGTVKEAVDAIAQALVDYGYCKEAKNYHITLSDRAESINQDKEYSFNSAGLPSGYLSLIKESV